jgi:DNA repair protein RadC
MTCIDRHDSSGLVSPLLSRQISRTLARLEAGTVHQVAQVDSRATVQAAQVDAVAAVAQRALQNVAFVTQVEQQLGAAVPLAVSRLQAIGDLSTLAMSQVVTDTAARLRRCSG